jgi:hypothetical protein
MLVARLGFIARRILAIALAGLIGGSVHGQDGSWLYRVEVPVVDQSAQARAQAARAALRVALTRLTGLDAMPQNPRLAEALGSPDGYYTQFGYAPGAEPGALQLVVQFSPPALQTLIRAAGLPIWPAARPIVLASITVATGAEDPPVTAAAAASIAAAMLTRAAERGLPLRLAEPPMPAGLAEDTPDETAAEPAVVPAFADLLLEADLRLDPAREQLEAAARNVGAELLLVVRADSDAMVNWRADAALYRPQAPVGAGQPDGSAPAEEVGQLAPEPTAPDVALAPPAPQPERFATVAEAPAELGRQLVDQLVGVLLERYQVLAGGAELQRVVVRGLQRGRDYAAVLRLFAAQEVIDDVSVAGVQADSVEFALATMADPERLQRLLIADGRLVPEPDQPLAEPASGLALRWRGP